MKIYTVHQAKTQLSKLIQKALAGEEIIISNRHKPVIKLTVIQQPERKLGFMGVSGVWMSKDFNEPLEDFKEYM
jgi:prevent-host-death family protein